MKIENIHIDGFGVWHDKTWDALAPGLNVFHGPNEAGKSTLMAFIRSILFGFERRGSPRRYEPLKGGQHGGWLDLSVGDTKVRVERKAGRHVRGTAVVYAADSQGDEGALERLLEGTTRTLYHNIFAFGLEELEEFHTLQETEVATHISGAGLGIGAARWAGVQKDIEGRQAALFLPRGQNSTINIAFKELESVRDDLERTQHEPQEYLAAHENRARLKSELAALEERLGDVTKKFDHYARRLKSRPLLERRTRLEARLRELATVDKFPDGGPERLELLNRQRRQLENDRIKLDREAEQRRLRRIEVHSSANPEECARRAQVIETLRSLVPRMDAARRVYAAGVERRDAIAQEKRTLIDALTAALPPTMFAFVLFVLLLWAGVIGLAWSGHEYIGAAIAAVSLAPILWYRQRLIKAAELEKQVLGCSVRLDACTAELRRTESEAGQIESEMRRLTGQDTVTQADIEARVADLERQIKYSDELRNLDEAAERDESAMQRLVHQIRETDQAVAALLSEAGAVSEQDFLERSEIYKQRRHLIHELEKIPVEAPEPGFLFDMHADEQAAFENAKRELAELEERLLQARHETGRIEERIAMMEKSEERSRALARQETILARIDEAAEEWAVLTLCRALLDETRKIYETERQPEVLRQASSFYAIMTEGRYTRVIAPLDGGEIQVERADGVRLSPSVLSRGTAEQLYLAMRLALVREYANHVDPLPVVFDDIFVNFDPERSRTCLKAVRELCTSHQVLLFTCHPHLLKQVEEIVPDVKVFPLQ